MTKGSVPLVERLRELADELVAPAPNLGGRPGEPGWTATQHAYLAGKLGRLTAAFMTMLPELIALTQSQDKDHEPR